jgi:hypothetical protein
VACKPEQKWPLDAVSHGGTSSHENLLKRAI